MGNNNQEFKTPQDALAHYGVKGMKWGIRKKDKGGKRRSAGDKELDALDAHAKKYEDRILEQAGVEVSGSQNRNRKLMIAAGLGLGVAAVAAGSYYAYSKQGGQGPGGNAADALTSQFHKGLENQLTKKLGPLDSLDDTDLTLPGSTVFRRVTGSANEAISDSHMYVSHLDEDADRYVGVFSKVVKNRAGAAYLSEIKVNSSVSSPSLKKRVEIMKGMLDEVDRDPKSLTEGMSFREVLIESAAASRAKALGGVSSDALERSLGRLSDDDLVRETYGSFVNGMGGQINNPQYRVSHVSSYLDKIRNMGYNALVDDANVGVLAKSPIILLRPQETVSDRVTTILSDQSVNSARDRIKKLADDLAVVRHAMKFKTPQDALAHYRIS